MILPQYHSINDLLVKQKLLTGTYPRVLDQTKSQNRCGTANGPFVLVSMNPV